MKQNIHIWCGMKIDIVKHLFRLCYSLAEIGIESINFCKNSLTTVTDDDENDDDDCCFTS
jgi:hypothetical protein